MAKKQTYRRKAPRPSKETQVSVRLDGDYIDRLDHVDKYAQMGRAELIRRAVNDFLNTVEEKGQLTVSAEVPPFNRREDSE